MKFSELIIGLAIGLPFGALLGVLFAPSKGALVKRKFFCKDKPYVNNLRLEFDDLVQRILKKYKCTQEEAEELVSKGKTEYKPPAKQ